MLDCMDSIYVRMGAQPSSRTGALLIFSCVACLHHYMRSCPLPDLDLGSSVSLRQALEGLHCYCVGLLQDQPGLTSVFRPGGFVCHVSWGVVLACVVRVASRLGDGSCSCVHSNVS
jgi:hypothetical protein